NKIYVIHNRIFVCFNNIFVLRSKIQIITFNICIIIIGVKKEELKFFAEEIFIQLKDFSKEAKENKEDCRPFNNKAFYLREFEKELSAAKKIKNCSPCIDITLCSSSLTDLCCNWRTDDYKLDSQSDHLPITFNILAQRTPQHIKRQKIFCQVIIWNYFDNINKKFRNIDKYTNEHTPKFSKVSRSSSEILEFKITKDTRKKIDYLNVYFDKKQMYITKSIESLHEIFCQFMSLNSNKVEIYH
ncbi:hypothetical protein RFI_25118, partial [Reticulomyxa filosa]